MGVTYLLALFDFKSCLDFFNALFLRGAPVLTVGNEVKKSRQDLKSKNGQTRLLEVKRGKKKFPAAHTSSREEEQEEEVEQ